MEHTPKKFLSIWWFAFGYFACYAPYSALTKYLTKYKGLTGSDPRRAPTLHPTYR